MSYNVDPFEPVRRYHAWEQEFERRQALRREPLDQTAEVALSPWSVFAGLMTALRGATGGDRRETSVATPWPAPVAERRPVVEEDERVLVGTRS